MKRIIITLLTMVGICSIANAQDKENKALAEPLPHKVENLELIDLSNNLTKLPMWGEKHLLIFYVDPDRYNQNNAFTVEIEENRAASSDKIYGFGVLNLKDTWLPNNVIRTIARKRTEKNHATIISDVDRTVATKWKLGDCNNQFIIMFVTKDGELVFCKKGAFTEADKAEFYEMIKKYS